VLDNQHVTVSEYDLSFTYSAYEYMLYYRNKPIGGACVRPKKNYKGMAIRSNSDCMRTQAQLELNRIVEGRADPYKKLAIEKIQAKEFHL
jgi:hypothetical protein